MGSGWDRVVFALASAIVAIAGAAHAQGGGPARDVPPADTAQEAPPTGSAPQPTVPDVAPGEASPEPAQETRAPGAEGQDAAGAPPSLVGEPSEPRSADVPEEPAPHEITLVEEIPEPRDGDPNTATPADERETPCCVTSHVRRWFVHVLGGVAGQESTGLVGGSLHVDLGSHPFLGSFGTGFSAGAEVLGVALIAAHVGIFAQLDLAYLAALFLWPELLTREMPFSLAVGGRLGMVYGRSQRDVEWVPDSFVFELVRPEWRFYVDLEIPVATLPGDVRMRVVGRLAALDWSIDLSELSRWTVQVGVAFEWVRDPLLTAGAAE